MSEITAPDALDRLLPLIGTFTFCRQCGARGECSTHPGQSEQYVRVSALREHLWRAIKP